MANAPTGAEITPRPTGPRDSDEQHVYRLIAEDRKRLNSFVRNLGGGVKVEDMSDELRSWWASRY